MRGVKNLSINKRNKNRLNILIGVVAILLLLFVVNIFVAPIRNNFLKLSEPIQKSFWSASESSSSFFSSFFQAGSLAKENENLKQENQNLISEVASLQSIEQGNQAQSDISATCQISGFKTVMAGAMGLDSDILSIDKGSADGISVGMPVINQQNVLVGKILKVYKNSSQIILISNKNSVINVEVQQSDITAPEIDGLVKGSGGLSAYLDSIQIQDTINSGDILVTSALDKTFPKNLLIGKINKVLKNDQKPFQQADVSLFFDVKTADNLFIIINYKQTK